MKKYFRLSILFSVLFVTLLIFGCSDNAVNQRGGSVDNLNLQITVAAQGMLDIVKSLRVITPNGIGEIDTTYIAYNYGNYEGSIEEVLAGDLIPIIVQALDETGRVIYEGFKAASINQDQENTINIKLSPKVAMIKLFPRYNKIAPGQEKSLDIEVYNLPFLNQISFRLHSSNPLHDPDPDSVTLSPRLLELGDNIIVFDTISYDPPYYAMSLANGGILPLVNDPFGDITLATLHYSADLQQEILPDTIIITFEALTMYDTFGNLIPDTMVVRDQCFIELIDFTDSIVTFPDPNLEQAIRNATGVSTRALMLSDVALMDILDADSMLITNLAGLEVCESLEELYLGDNGVRDLSALTNLNFLYYMDLSNNLISDIQALVDNQGIGSGAYINLTGNSLSAISIATHIPALLLRGVTVDYDL